MALNYEVRKTPGNTEWFVHDRFGMFIHWGLYALPARHEWIKNLEKITEEKYQKYFEYFDPDMYDPREWARAAKKAGMKYAVLTTKHMRDSAFSIPHIRTIRRQTQKQDAIWFANMSMLSGKRG